MMINKLFGKKYIFSVIVPVYNTEQYVRETIDSVINQTVGFDNIQLVLVNNGSTDSSYSICQSYKAAYPKNIELLNIEINRGVSRARNLGLDCAKGKYISFLDSDDKWDYDALALAKEFLDENGSEVDCVACRVKFFDRRDDYHSLDYKYDQTRIVDVSKEYNYVQLAINNVVFKSEALNGVRFNEELFISEDSLFASNVIMRKMRYGLLREAEYLYRKRSESDSTIDSKIYDYNWFFNTPQKGYKGVFELSDLYCNEITKYAQYLVMYDIQWRLLNPDTDILSQDEQEEYIDYIKYLLGKIDDSIIMEQKNIKPEHKIFSLTLKHGEGFFDKCDTKDDGIYYNDLKIFDLPDKDLFVVRRLFIDEHGVNLEGWVSVPFPENYWSVSIKDTEGNCFSIEYYDGYNIDSESFWTVVKRRRGFRQVLPIDKGGTYAADLVILGKAVPLKMNFGKWSKLTNSANYSFFSGGTLNVYQKDGRLYIYDTVSANKLEELFERELSRNNDAALKGRVKALKIKAESEKPIWLISDDMNIGRGFGKTLFDYLLRNHDDVEVFYVVGSEDDNYESILRKDRMVTFRSREHKELYLKSRVVISTCLDERNYGPYDKYKEFLRDCIPLFFHICNHIDLERPSNDYMQINNNIDMVFTNSNEVKAFLTTKENGFKDKEVFLSKADDDEIRCREIYSMIIGRFS